MLHFYGVVISEQSCGSLTGQGEKASVERHIAAGHLQDTVVSGSQQRKEGERQEQTFHLVHFV